MSRTRDPLNLARFTRPDWYAETAQEHAEADARCGRDWLTRGCYCATCRTAKAKGWTPAAPEAPR